MEWKDWHLTLHFAEVFLHFIHLLSAIFECSWMFCSFLGCTRFFLPTIFQFLKFAIMVHGLWPKYNQISFISHVCNQRTLLGIYVLISDTFWKAVLWMDKPTWKQLSFWFCWNGLLYLHFEHLAGHMNFRMDFSEHRSCTETCSLRGEEETFC